jgi:thiamine pyrophosphate-dependent acetolactate synthase large subunit-like protein
LGSRIDICQTGSSIRDFEGDKFIYCVNIYIEELDGRISASREVLTEIDDFFEMLERVEISVDSSTFLEEIERDKKEFPQNEEQESQLEMDPNILIERLSQIFSNVEGYDVDVWQHQM